MSRTNQEPSMPRHNLKRILNSVVAMLQRHCIIGDVLWLLHLQKVCNDVGAELAQNGSLSWRLSRAIMCAACLQSGMYAQVWTCNCAEASHHW